VNAFVWYVKGVVVVVNYDYGRGFVVFSCGHSHLVNCFYG
jgi:hypothetical protein